MRPEARLDRVAQSVLASGDALVNEREYLVAKTVHPRQNYVGYHLSGLLVNALDRALVQRHDPVLRRVLALDHECTWTRTRFQQVSHGVPVYDVVPREHKEISRQSLPRAQQCVSVPQLLLLDDVLDPRAELLAVLEVGHDAFLPVPHDDYNLAHIVLHERVHDIL